MSKTTRVASYTKDTPEFLMPKMPKSNLHFVWGIDGALHIIPIDDGQPTGIKVVEQYHDETGKMTDPEELARMLSSHGALLAACKDAFIANIRVKNLRPPLTSEAAQREHERQCRLRDAIRQAEPEEDTE